MAGSFPQREFGQLKGQARLAKIAAAKRTDYWAGSTWVYQCEITNAAGAASNLVWTFTPGEDNEIEVMTGQILNDDISSNVVRCRVLDDEDNRVALWLSGSIAANGFAAFPTRQQQASNLAGSASGRLIISGAMQLEITLENVAASQDATVGLVCRVRGDKPTHTESGNAGASINVRKDQFF